MRLLTANIANLATISLLDPKELFKDVLDSVAKESSPLRNNDDAFLSVFALDRSSHALILARISERAKEISEIKTTAPNKIEALLPLSRFLLPISRADAEALFARAHQITDEIDLTAIHQLKCVASLVVSSKQAINEGARREVSRVFYSIVTDSALRLAGEDGFPWENTSSAFALFDLPSSLAALARWEDSGITDRETCLLPILMSALKDNSITAEEAAALLPLINRTNVSLVRKIMELLGNGKSASGKKIIETLARDLVLRPGTRKRHEIGKVLNEFLAPNQEKGPWLSQLNSLVTFITEHDKRTGELSKTDLKRGVEIKLESPSPSTIAEMCVSVGGLSSMITSMSRSGVYVSETEILESIRTHVPADKHVHYLRALSDLGESVVFGRNIAEGLAAAIRWTHPAISEWRRTELGKVISRRLPEFARGLSFEDRAPVIFLLDALPDPSQNIPKVLIEGIAANVERLDARSIYAITSEIIKVTESSQAYAILSSYIGRLIARIPQRDLDNVDFSNVPASIPAAVARFLFALCQIVIFAPAGGLHMRCGGSHDLVRLQTYKNFSRFTTRKMNQSFALPILLSIGSQPDFG